MGREDGERQREGGGEQESIETNERENAGTKPILRILT